MKTILAALMLVLASSLYAQEETLLGGSDVDHGGYGALVIKFTSVNDQLGVLVGGRGGWIINHAFSLGGAGYGLANNVPSRITSPFGGKYVMLGYGGLDMEYVFNSNDLVHLSFHTLIGAGSVGFRTRDSIPWGGTMWDPDLDWDHHFDDFFVMEPGVNIDLNVTRWFRASLGASYRYVSGVAQDVSSNNDLKGPSASLMLRFGSF